MKTTPKFIATLISILIIGSAGMVSAQDSTRISPFHLSFITPLGTNGLQSWNTTNLISINLFAGFSGGLRGIEMAGFANALKGDINGIQMAGFCNNTLGRANGLELAGYWNFNRKKVNGCQFSGFANVALDTVDGIQASGFANVTIGEMKGVQAAGFANVTTGKQTGLQASGFLNYTRNLHGVQLGFINITDTVEKGIPIGIISLVKNGYHVIQVGGNETLWGEVSFKTGVRRFYNIFSLGAAGRNGDIRWGFGYGVGTLVPLGKRLDMSLELVSYQISENAWYSDYMNMLNRFNLALSWNFTRTLGLYAGASWNVLVKGNEITWEHPHHYTSDVSSYPGFTAGMRIGI